MIPVRDVRALLAACGEEIGDRPRRWLENICDEYDQPGRGWWLPTVGGNRANAGTTIPNMIIQATPNRAQPGLAVAGGQPEVERLCEVMHDAYEQAAAGAGWETQQASRKPWADVPEPNRVTMRAAVRALLAAQSDQANLGLATTRGADGPD